MLTAQLLNIPGVQQRLVSIVSSSSNYKVIVGGGDVYQVAYAIYIALGLNINQLVGSSTSADTLPVLAEMPLLYPNLFEYEYYLFKTRLKFTIKNHIQAFKIIYMIREWMTKLYRMFFYHKSPLL